MTGLKQLFFRIIPIVMLLCFVSYGITIIFNVENLTYLRHVTEDANGNPLANPYYEYDFASYVRRINFDLLSRAITNVIDTQTFRSLLNSWKVIWEDGYQIGDIFTSIVNGFIMVVDLAITGLNMFIVPIRIVAGILLTGLNIIGINIYADGVILRGLMDLVGTGTINLIQPMTN